MFEQSPKLRIDALFHEMQPDNISGQNEGFRQTFHIRAHARYGTHRTAKLRTLEISGSILFRDGERKRPEPFPVLDEIVEIFFYVGRPRRSQHAAFSQRARTELCRALEPGDNLARL